MKKIAMIAFALGLFLVICAVGSDDFYVMELHQAHAFDWKLCIFGIMLCLPMPIISLLNGEE